MKKSIIKSEIKKVIMRNTTWIAFAIFILAYIFALYKYIQDIPVAFKDSSSLRVYSGFESFVSIISSYSSFMFLVTPLCIILIVGDSLYCDYKTGFFDLTLYRANIKDYILGKIIGNGIAIFSSLMALHIIVFIISLFAVGFRYPELNEYVGDFPEFLRGLLLKSPYLYSLLIMLIISSMGAAFSSASILMANYFKSKISATIVPWIVYLIVGETLYLIYNPSFIYNLSPIVMSGPFIYYPRAGAIYHFLYWIILFSFFSVWAYISTMRRFKTRSE